MYITYHIPTYASIFLRNWKSHWKYYNFFEGKNWYIRSLCCCLVSRSHCRLHVTTSNHGNPPSIPVLFVRIMKKKRSNYHKKVGLCYDLTKMTTNTKKAREKLNVLTTWETILGIMYRNMLHSRYHLLS